MRTCVQLLRSLEEKMEPFVGTIIAFCAQALAEAQAFGNVVIPSLDFLLLVATLNKKLLITSGDALLKAILQFILAAGERPDLILEASEVLGQLALLALPGSYADMMKKAHDEEDEEDDIESKEKDEDDDEEDDEDEDEARLNSPQLWSTHLNSPRSISSHSLYFCSALFN